MLVLTPFQCNLHSHSYGAMSSLLVIDQLFGSDLFIDKKDLNKGKD